jgi:biotin operon repressor
MVTTNEQIVQAIKLYKSGTKVRDIVDLVGINAGALSVAIRQLRDLGVDIPKRAAEKRNWNEIVELLK